jgi:hypothetical protein
MTGVWSLSTNGSPAYTLVSLGIEDSTVVKNSLQVSQWSFRIPKFDGFPGPLFEYDDKLVLYLNGVAKFRGRVAQRSTSVTAGREFHHYRVNDAWADLACIPYQQPRTMENFSFTGTTLVTTTRVILGKDVFGNRASIQQQLSAIASYAATNSADVLPVELAGANQFVPFREELDIMCSEAMRRMLALSPDAASWIDYSTSPAGLYIRQRATMETVSLDVNDANRLITVELTDRKDLVPLGVVLNYEGSVTNPADGVSYPTNTQDTAGATSGRRVLIATIALNGLGTTQENPADLGAPLDMVPIGLAALYYNTLLPVQWEGQIVIKEDECSGIYHPGQKFNVLNGDARWATMAAIAQSVEEEHSSGTTTINVGPSESLNADSFVKLLLFNRAPRGGDRPPGGTGFDPSNPTKKPLQNTRDITGCVDGNTKTITVLVP